MVSRIDELGTSAVVRAASLAPRTRSTVVAAVDIHRGQDADLGVGHRWHRVEVAGLVAGEAAGGPPFAAEREPDQGAAMLAQPVRQPFRCVHRGQGVGERLQHDRDGQVVPGPVRVRDSPGRGIQGERINLDSAVGAFGGSVEQAEQHGAGVPAALLGDRLGMYKGAAQRVHGTRFHHGEVLLEGVPVPVVRPGEVGQRETRNGQVGRLPVQPCLPLASRSVGPAVRPGSTATGTRRRCSGRPGRGTPGRSPAPGSAHRRRARPVRRARRRRSAARRVRRACWRG